MFKVFLKPTYFFISPCSGLPKGVNYELLNMLKVFFKLLNVFENDGDITI